MGRFRCRDRRPAADAGVLAEIPAVDRTRPDRGPAGKAGGGDAVLAGRVGSDPRARLGRQTARPRAGPPRPRCGERAVGCGRLPARRRHLGQRRHPRLRPVHRRAQRRRAAPGVARAGRAAAHPRHLRDEQPVGGLYPPAGQPAPQRRLPAAAHPLPAGAGRVRRPGRPGRLGGAARPAHQLRRPGPASPCRRRDGRGRGGATRPPRRAGPARLCRSRLRQPQRSPLRRADQLGPARLVAGHGHRTCHVRAVGRAGPGLPPLRRRRRPGAASRLDPRKKLGPRASNGGCP